MRAHDVKTLLTRSGADPSLSRRSVLAVGMLSTVALAACSAGPDQAPEPAASVDLGGEAPILAERVKSGDLPPVGERLPKNPLTVTPHEKAGVYGGTWQTAINGPTDTAWFDRTMAYEGLLRFIPTWTGAAGDSEVIANIAESYEISDEGRKFTFVLREGMRWSDGEPFTTEDIEFAYESVHRSADIGPTPALFVSGGEQANLEVHDETSFTLEFTNPQGLFLATLAEGRHLLLPKHYLAQFHPDHSDGVEKDAKDAGFGHWVEYYASKATYTTNTELPTLNPWIITTGVGESSAVVAERNPYYFKVDPGGNQLPYIDQVRYQVMAEEEVILAAAMQGDLSFHVRHFHTAANKPVLANAREQGGFDFVDISAGLGNELVIMLNLTHTDEVKRQIYRNKDFRIGLSHAIDRGEMINSVYQRQGTAAHASPQTTSPFYSETLSTQYTQYDVDLANQHLDKAGFTERDGSGNRLGPDGKPIRINVEHSSMPGFDDALALVATCWRAVGISMTPDSMDRSLYEERRRGNLPAASVWQAGGGTDVIQNPFWYAPLSERSDYAQLWARWYISGGTSGEEPPANTKRQMDLYDEIKQTVDAARQTQLMNELLKLAAEEFYHIGMVLPGNGYGIKKNDFHNVPSGMPDSVRVSTPALTNPEQYFIQ